MKIFRSHRSFLRPKDENISSSRLDKVLPPGIKIVAWERTIRWIGWGFGESLIPLFIFSFSHTFAEAGLLKSVYEIAAIFSLPIAGALADKISAKYLILIALALYPFVGISYFLAGIFGMAIFIVIARMLNGVLWGLEDIGVSTYYRRMAGRDVIASAFGYIDSLAHFGWIAAALLGMLLVPFVPIHWLLVGVAPFALIAFVVAKRAPKDLPGGHKDAGKSVMFSSYRKTIAQWRSWNSHLWLLSMLVLLSGIISALMWFFIPIDAYITGTQPVFVVLLMVVAAIPLLLGYPLGKIVDRYNEYALIIWGLVGVAIIMGGVALLPQYAVTLAASFLLGIILELFSVIQKRLVTTLGPAETYGERGSAFDSIIAFGDLGAPLILGISLDLLGFTNVAMVVVALAVLLGVGFSFAKKHARI